MSQIALSAGMRNNLLSLQNTQSMLSKTQERLASGRKINSALDGPSNFFTAQGMTQRSNQLTSLLDSMNNGVQTIRAADQGFKSVTKLLDNLMSTARQARQDASTNNAGGGLTFGTSEAARAFAAAETPGGTLVAGQMRIDGQTIDLTMEGKVLGATFANAANGETDNNFGVDYDDAGPTGTGNQVTLGNNAGEIVITASGINAVTVEFDSNDNADDVVRKINEALDGVSGGQNFRASRDEFGAVQMVDFTGGDSDLRIRDVTNQEGSNSTTQTIFGNTAVSTLDPDGVQTAAVDQRVALTNELIAERINANEALADTVRASVDEDGGLRLENLTLDNLEIQGFNFTGPPNSEPRITGDLDNTIELTPGSLGNSERRAAMQQEFNTLIEQLDQTVRDAGFNGVNLLQGDSLRVVFNELTGADQSSLNVRLNNADGSAFGGVSASSLGIETGANFQSNADLDSLIDSLTNATSQVRDLNSQMSSNLSVVENRQDFTKGMVNILQTGADNLTLADMNEEAANSLALQTRQQLGQTAMSLTAQQDQSILALLR